MPIAGSKPEQSSSRWLSREDREGPIREIYDRHKSPESRRHDGNEASAKEQDKRETNVGAFIAGQQSGDGVLSGGQGLRDEWVTPISSLKREKGRMKKSKRAPEVYTADFAEDQNVSWKEEGAVYSLLWSRPTHLKLIRWKRVGAHRICKERKPKIH
ncbi:hypothetical protein Ancab_008442 [Ancistrocladus abbreviatus]